MQETCANEPVRTGPMERQEGDLDAIPMSAAG